jgi:peroxiredoxin
MAASPPICDFGWKALPFTLPGTDGRMHSLDGLKGRNGTLIAFICNHCPYVKSVIGRLVRDAKDLAALGVSTIAINANDAAQYPEDGLDRMKAFAAAHGLPFPYLHDETQAVARAYGAVCTPDFFGFNAGLELQYRGRLDASRKDLVPDARRDLYEAMKQVAETGRGPADQIASMGCSIKWKAA